MFLYILKLIIVIVIISLFLFFVLRLIKRYIFKNFFILIEEVIEEPDLIRKKSEKKHNNEIKEKNKQKEKIKEQNLQEDLEIDLEPEIINNVSNKKNIAPKIVGIKMKNYGKFTNKIIQAFMGNMSSINKDDLINKGYYQAMEISRKGQVDVNRGRK